MTRTSATGVDTSYDAVVFDLLTALINSWTLWNEVAGSEADGLRWRQAYLKLTYGAGAYRPYETIIGEAADTASISETSASELLRRWGELAAWPETSKVLSELAICTKLAVVTNCSRALGHIAASNVSDRFFIVVTAEDAGFYKPRTEPYAMALRKLGTDPSRTLFVAGSASDVPGASALGMPVYWHNRIGMPSADNTSPLYHERSLDRLIEIVRG